MKAAEIFKVEGLSTVVTAGASGVGLACAEAMAANGANVTILDIDEAALNAAVERLKAAGGDARGALVDVRDKAALDAAMAEVVARRGRLDVLFANAGISGGPGFLAADMTRPEATAFENLPTELWDRVISFNIGTMVKTIQAALPHMKRQGSGSIVATSSCSATKTELHVGSAYVASKAAVAHLVRQLAIETARHNVRVNAIAPGPIVTNIGGGRLKDPATQAFFGAQHPSGRMGRPDDLIGAALLLASPASRHMHGAEILVDGGFTLGRTE
jgi:NAD(P)-dependent dehydrogenase (short-subunit alcohol dehydrogenase family)